MPLSLFEGHLIDPAPGFRCYACGDRSEALQFLARVRSVVGRPGSAESIAAVTKAFGAASPALTRFVELHDGVLLYRDGKSDSAGIKFFQATKWQSRTDEMRDSMISMGFEEDEMPEWFHRGVVIGEIPYSANYFVILPSGDEAGQVFYCDHEDFRTEPIAESFEDLLTMIVKDPPDFLYKCGCFSRYADGNTDTQWIPKKYIADCRGL